MKLYAAMVIGITLGVGIALVLAARELEDAAPVTTATTPSGGSLFGVQPSTGA